MPLLRYGPFREWLAKEKGVVLSEAWFRRAVSLKQIPFVKIGKAVYFDTGRAEIWLAEKAVEPRKATA